MTFSQFNGVYYPLPHFNSNTFTPLGCSRLFGPGSVASFWGDHVNKDLVLDEYPDPPIFCNVKGNPEKEIGSERKEECYQRSESS